MSSTGPLPSPSGSTALPSDQPLTPNPPQTVVKSESAGAVYPLLGSPNFPSVTSPAQSKPVLAGNLKEPYQQQRRASEDGVFAVPGAVKAKISASTSALPVSLGGSSQLFSAKSVNQQQANNCFNYQKQTAAPGKDRKIKKPKSKAGATKPRTIKFHEYKVRFFKDEY